MEYIYILKDKRWNGKSYSTEEEAVDAATKELMKNQKIDDSIDVFKKTKELRIVATLEEVTI